MTALGVIQATLLISSAALGGLLAPIVHYQIYRHLRRQHRKTFDRLGISPSASFIWRDFWRDDCEEDNSSVAFERFRRISRRHPFVRGLAGEMPRRLRACVLHCESMQAPARAHAAVALNTP
jgi:hypothetical protein